MKTGVVSGDDEGERKAFLVRDVAHGPKCSGARVIDSAGRSFGFGVCRARGNHLLECVAEFSEVVPQAGTPSPGAAAKPGRELLSALRGVAKMIFQTMPLLA
ncbi:MAG TPA: hypothetical protein VNA69_00060 [Thermoanaerobaculia bacterium]|nr:hypothetical protein [Thermoanaerobaculia bacterium]